MPPQDSNADPTQRFSSRADYYAKSRPRYPRTLLDFCRTNLGLKPENPIADIGSGTGILTELFLQNANPIFAVEPNEPMRRQAEKSLAQFNNFHSIPATAEAITLPAQSVDFILAGQAFHWFDRPRAAPNSSASSNPPARSCLSGTTATKPPMTSPLPMILSCASSKPTGTKSATKT